MVGAPVKSVVITRDNEAPFLRKLGRLKDRTRKRAFELYCHRSSLGAGTGTADEDWLQAERETLSESQRERMLSPLAGIEDNGNEIRIIAAVPDVDAAHLTVDVLPRSIVVEGEASGDPAERYSVFPLNGPIEPAAVKAEFANGDLTIVAPKHQP